MAVYINGRPVNPIVSFLASVLGVAATVGIVILLLPLIGGILVFALVAVLALIAYGAYYRWKNADAIREMQKNISAAFGGGFAQNASEDTSRETPRSAFRTTVKTKTGVKRTSTVDDAVVIEEIRHVKIQKTE